MSTWDTQYKNVEQGADIQGGFHGVQPDLPAVPGKRFICN